MKSDHFCTKHNLAMERNKKDEELYYRQTQMTYIEYLEALARVALEAFGTDVSGVHGMDLPKALEKLATCYIRQLVIQHSLNAKEKRMFKENDSVIITETP